LILNGKGSFQNTEEFDKKESRVEQIVKQNIYTSTD
jgi:hypothetical protein